MAPSQVNGLAQDHERLECDGEDGCLVCLNGFNPPIQQTTAMVLICFRLQHQVNLFPLMILEGQGQEAKDAEDHRCYILFRP